MTGMYTNKEIQSTFLIGAQGKHAGLQNEFERFISQIQGTTSFFIENINLKILKNKTISTGIGAVSNL